MRAAFLGLGRMGWHMASHLARHEDVDEVVVYDAVERLGQDWALENPGQVAASLQSAVAGAGHVFSSLPADRELIAVRDQILEEIEVDAIWVDHSTTSARAARETAEKMSVAGAHFIDAPVSGGVDGARSGSLSVMAGGDQECFSRAEPIIGSYASRVKYMGSSGAGQLTKMTNQICVVGLCQALAEGLDFATRAGLDTRNVVEAMLQGSSTSWQMANRSDKMLDSDYDFGFSTTLMRKDIGLVLEEASDMNISLPVTSLVGQFLADVTSMGGANWDWCSLMERQKRFSSNDSENHDL